MKKRKLINMIFSLIAFCMIGIATMPIVSAVKASAVAQVTTPVDPEFFNLTTKDGFAPIKAQVGYGSIAYNKNVANNPISLFVDGTKRFFDKGIVAHAASTVVYDLQNYNNFDLFTSYLGVDASQGSNGSVIFKISVSNNNTDWIQRHVSPQALTGSGNAEKISVDIKGFRYLKLYADPNGSNGNDHAAYGDPKIIKKGYVDPEEQFMSQLDTTIKAHGITDDLSAIELTLLQRTFVKKAGYDSLKKLCEADPKHEEVIRWLATDLDILREYLTSGNPEEGSYADSLEILSNLYNTYKSDLSVTTVNAVSGEKDADVYKRMMLALSLTHTRDIAFWQDTVQKSDPIVRYKVFKDLRTAGLLENKIFDKIPVITMRLVFNSMVTDPSIAWLNNFSREKKAASSDPNFDEMSEWNYFTYTDRYNYNLPKYYSVENYATWNAKYKLEEYGIPYGEIGRSQLWITFEEGGVCGAQAKTGTNLNTSRGIPALVIGQPAHASYMIYKQDDAGVGSWVLGKNNIDGWAYSNWTWEGFHPTGWGAESWAVTFQASFTILAQAAINDMPNYIKAEESLFLADVYRDDKVKLEEIYNLALSQQAINYDAWKGLVDIYIADSTKTDAQKFELEEKIATALTFYPHPMMSLLKRLDTSITDDIIILKSTTLKDTTLIRATQATSADTLQYQDSQLIAQEMIKKSDLTIANFSFDGTNANKIVLAEKFKPSSARLKYSLDGGTTWISTEDKSILLTNEQIESITPTNDIHVGVIGSNTTQVIDIKQADKPTNLYSNDLENVIWANGETALIEWSYDKITWTKFNDIKPDATGTKSVYVRTIANTQLKASEPITYNFTDTVDLSRKYIPITELSIEATSSNNSATQNGENVIDGNKYTMWLSKTDLSDTEKSITIKLDTPKYISALEYLPAQRNGNIWSGTVLTSLDGVTFTEAAVWNFWGQMDSYNMTLKTVPFNKPLLASYVKFDANVSHQNYASVAIINLFEAVPAGIDNIGGTNDLNDNAESNNSDLNIKITKNANEINTVKVGDKTYLLNNPEDLTALAGMMNLEPTEDGYNITLLKSWMDTLPGGKDYPITFIADNNKELVYTLHIIDTSKIDNGNSGDFTGNSNSNADDKDSYLTIKIIGGIAGIIVLSGFMVFIILKWRRKHIL